MTDPNANGPAPCQACLAGLAAAAGPLSDFLPGVAWAYCEHKAVLSVFEPGDPGWPSIWHHLRGISLADAQRLIDGLGEKARIAAAARHTPTSQMLQ